MVMTAPCSCLTLCATVQWPRGGAVNTTGDCTVYALDPVVLPSFAGLAASAAAAATPRVDYVPVCPIYPI